MHPHPTPTHKYTNWQSIYLPIRLYTFPLWDISPFYFLIILTNHFCCCLLTSSLFQLAWSFSSQNGLMIIQMGYRYSLSWPKTVLYLLEPFKGRRSQAETPIISKFLFFDRLRANLSLPTDHYDTQIYKGESKPCIAPSVMASPALGLKLGVFGFLRTTQQEQMRPRFSRTMRHVTHVFLHIKIRVQTHLTNHSYFDQGKNLNTANRSPMQGIKMAQVLWSPSFSSLYMYIYLWLKQRSWVKIAA